MPFDKVGLALFLLSVAAASARADSPCGHRYAQTVAECEAMKAWTPENFTDPERLDGAHDFRIVFHSISAYNWIDGAGPEAGSWNEKLLGDPALLAGNPKISASVVTPRNRWTFLGYIGYILEVHPENVVASGYADIGSPRVASFAEDDLRGLEEYSKAPTIAIRPPDDVAEHSRRSYNEVVFTGRDPRTDSVVRPLGVVIRCDRDRRMHRLNDLTPREFRRYVERCQKWDDSVYDALETLRQKYPTFGFALE